MNRAIEKHFLTSMMSSYNFYANKTVTFSQLRIV